jgi:hypothetical protein
VRAKCTSVFHRTFCVHHEWRRTQILPAPRHEGKESDGSRRVWFLRSVEPSHSRALAGCMTTGPTMRDIAVQLTHYPGELARVAAVLSQHRVNLTSLTGLAIGPHVTIRLIPDDIDAARAAFDAAGIRFQENEIVQVLLENRAGELAMISTRLAEGGVNLRAIYVTGRVGNLVELALVPDNVTNAKRLLE